MKRLFALLLAVLMVFSLVACTKAPADTTTKGASNDTTAADDTTAAPADDTTAADGEGEVEYLGEVEIMNGEAASAGLCVGWMPDWIRSKIGVDMIGLPGDTEQVDSYLAGGELPDVTILKNIDQLEAAIEGGMIIDLETVKDKLPNVFETYWDACEGMVNYNKAVKSAGTGKLYGLARMFNGEPVPAYDIGGVFLRYDVYGQVGYPEIKNYDDLLNCLIAMQEACPTSLDGGKMYAMSMHSEWNTGLFYGYKWVSRNRGLWDQGMWAFDMTEYDGTTESMKVVKQLEVGSDYYEFVKFMFKANQAGLIDPNSLTQTNDEAKAVMQNGGALLQWDNWGTTYDLELQNQGIGCRRVPIGEYMCAQEMDITYESKSQIVISSTCKNLDAACALVNLMYDPAFTISYMNGPQGQVWDYDENGAPYFLEGGYEAMNSLNFSERGCIIMLTYHFSGQMPGCPEGITSDYSTWPCYNEMVADGTIVETKVISDWKEHTSNGYHLLTDYFKEKGKLILSPSAASRTLSTDESMSESRLNDRINVGTWACIFAADEATFDAEWDAMYNECVGMGYNEFVDTMAAYKIADVEEFQQYVK